MVLQHIRPVAPSLVVPYLEYVIMKEGETNPLFHNELILNYLFTIQQLRESDTSATDFSRTKGNSLTIKTTSLTLFHILQRTSTASWIGGRSIGPNQEKAVDISGKIPVLQPGEDLWAAVSLHWYTSSLVVSQHMLIPPPPRFI